MLHSAFARRMGLMISASVPKVFYTLHVLKLRQVGVEGMKICHLAIFLPDLAGTAKVVGAV